MSYCTYQDVINMSGVNAKKLGFTKESDFYALLEEWITQAESFINSYCKRNWNPIIDGETITEVTVPPAVKNVCIRLTSNIIAFNYKRRDNPVKKVNDYSVTVFESDVFTDDLKDDLKPFIKPPKVKVFKI